mgnify:CR=1 FL=1
MKRDEIFKFIENYLINFGGIEFEINEKTNIKNELNLDSLDMLEIIFELENEYKIDIDAEIFSELKTIEDVVNYVIDLL